MKRAVTRISDMMEYAAAAVLMLMMLHIVIDVFAKYLFSTSIPGTLDVVANYYMVATVYLPVAFVELRGRSISVDLFYQWFPDSMKYLARVFGTAVSILFFSLLAYQTSFDAVQSFAKGEFVDGAYIVITWPARFVLPLSFGLVVIVLLVRIVHELRSIEDIPLVPVDHDIETDSPYEGIE